MEQQPIQPSFLDRFNQWIEESITIKLFSIGFLVLMLLIPSSWINSLMEEREGRAEDAMQEVYQKWSNSQTLSGPVLVIPYRTLEKVALPKKEVEYREKVMNYYFLSEKLSITGNITPEVLHRGIFDAVVYNAELSIEAEFVKPDFAALGIDEDKVEWKKAHLVYAITDLRGISDNPTIKVGSIVRESEPSSTLGLTASSVTTVTPTYTDDGEQVATTRVSTETGIVAKLLWQGPDDFKKDVSLKLNLKGSKYLHVLPTGKTTLVNLQGPWATPSFDGEFLPAERTITDTDFSAQWKILHFNRAFAQQWTGTKQALNEASFGVRLLIPVDQYQKSIRTAKYGVLIIILTFISLFLVEITKRIRIHPFQYILIGVALIIYYTLLLSISEQVGYNLAYGIASAATIGLISLYAASFLREAKLILLFSSLLTLFYTFIFVIILQQDFSLLLGSIGLFLIVGALMYFSRKVSWYKGPTSIQ